MTLIKRYLITVEWDYYDTSSQVFDDYNEALRAYNEYREYDVDKVYLSEIIKADERQ